MYSTDWAWDLLTAVQQFEETHSKADECLSAALEAVPESARIFAAGMHEGVMRELRKQLSSVEVRGTGTPTGAEEEDPWCRDESCRHRYWRSGSMPTHKRGSECPSGTPTGDN